MEAQCNKAGLPGTLAVWSEMGRVKTRVASFVREVKRHADPCVACRKSPAPKAWSQGTNPITQRPTNPTPSNGVATAPKPSASLSRETATPMRHLSDRMMYLLANLTVRKYGRYSL
jgi:hypothetical protein